MQMKTFETIQRQVIPQAGVNSLVIEVTDNIQENFHGIRFSGRLAADFVTAGILSGFVTLMCIPNDQIAIPNLQSEADLNDSNSFIIAVEAYSLHTESMGTENRYGATYDFEFAPKTSRSCMKGGKIVGQVTVNGGVGQTVETAILSTFRTTV